ncbi:MAG: hypothetical protein AAF483_27245, partial [Planctomycetota bacterium]
SIDTWLVRQIIVSILADSCSTEAPARLQDASISELPNSDFGSALGEGQPKIQLDKLKQLVSSCGLNALDRIGKPCKQRYFF